MNKQIDAEKLINTLVSKIAELELENAKLKVLIDTEVEEQTEVSEWADKFTINNLNNRRWLIASCFIKKGDLTMTLKTQQTVTITGTSEIDGV